MFCEALSCATSPAACQVVPLVSFAFQYDDIRNTKLGQVVGNGASDDATTYDDDFGRCDIRARHSELRSRARSARSRLHRRARGPPDTGGMTV